MTTRRLNARLPAETATKVAYLERHEELSTTEVLLESIDHYYRAVTEREGAGERRALAGFIGCARGPADLSETYQSGLPASLARKT